MTIAESASAITPHPSSASVLEFGPFRFDRSHRILLREGKEILLPPRILALLELLLDRSGRVVEKQQILDTIWGDTAVSDTSLTEAVSQLRLVLGDDAQKPSFVQTVHRRGYRFIAPVVPVHPVPPALSPDRAPEQSRSAGNLTAIITVGVAIVVGILGAWAVTRMQATRSEGAAPTPGLIRFSISPPGGEAHALSTMAISRDGRMIVFAAGSEAERHLYLRALDSSEARRIEGTRGGTAPMFSPDGRWIAYFSGEKLHRIPVGGGTPIAITDAPHAGGGSWTDDDEIIFSSIFPSGLRSVPSGGGEVVSLTTPDSTRGELGHQWPDAIAGADLILYTVWGRSTIDSARVAVLDRRTGENTTLLEGAAGARWSPSGHLLYAKQGALLAAPFDPFTRSLGKPIVVVDGVGMHPLKGTVHFAVSHEGTLVHRFATNFRGERILSLLSPEGSFEDLPFPPRLYRNLAVSPEGDHFAMTILEGDRSDLWIGSVDDGSLRRLTFEGFNIEPVWSRDGEWAYFASDRTGPFNIYRKRADGSGESEPIMPGSQHEYPMGFAPDGTLLFSRVSSETGFDLWIAPTGGPSKQRKPLVTGTGHSAHGAFSPDGRWVAYDSSHSGKWTIYLTSIEPETGTWEISSDDFGAAPFWSRDGRVLYYHGPTHLMAVAVALEGRPVLGRPEPVAPLHDLAKVADHRGRLVVIRETAEPVGPQALQVTIGWPALLEE
jgi:eukaryotic-like serine/threonine-protein kinase